VEWLLVQDLFTSPVCDQAKYVLPATSSAEKQGTFVNHANLAQTIHRAIRPPQEARTEGQVYLDLLQRPGLIQPALIRKELAKEVPFFASLEAELDEHGRKLAAT
jgi:NADH-quinone oxidoreductase subunit G